MPRSPRRFFCPARLHAHTSTFAARAIIFVQRLCRGGGIDCDVDTRAGWAFPIGMRLLACRRPYGRCTCKARTWLAKLRPPLLCAHTDARIHPRTRVCGSGRCSHTWAPKQTQQYTGLGEKAIIRLRMSCFQNCQLPPSRHSHPPQPVPFPWRLQDAARQIARRCPATRTDSVHPPPPQDAYSMMPV